MSPRFHATRHARVSTLDKNPDPESQLRQLGAHFFFREAWFGRCVKAEPAADLAALLEFGSRSTFEAADPTRLLVTSRFAVRFAIHFLLGLMINDTLHQVHRRKVGQHEKRQNDQHCREE